MKLLKILSAALTLQAVNGSLASHLKPDLPNAPEIPERIKHRVAGQPRKILFHTLFVGSHHKNQRELLNFLAD